MIFKPEEMIGIIDLRSLGYYKIKQGILHWWMFSFWLYDVKGEFSQDQNQFLSQ